VLFVFEHKKQLLHEVKVERPNPTPPSFENPRK